MSNRDQEQFIGHIAERLGRKPLDSPPAHPFRGAPDFWRQYNLSVEERITLFMDNWQKVGGHAQRFSNLQDVQAYIAELAESMGAKHMIRNHQAELQELNIEGVLPAIEMTVWGKADETTLKEKAAGADLGIVVADYAVAATGSVVLKSNEHKGRIVSLLPTALFILIPVDVMKTRLGEVMSELHQLSANEMPAGIHFVSGPSRSADIENDLTIGVHGPGVVYALIYGE